MTGDEPSPGDVNRPRPAHLSLANIGLVGFGGSIGTSLRYLITALTPRTAGVPIATLSINVIGAFLLGVLLEFLAEHGLRAAWSRRLWLGVGTGGLGGFTTVAAALNGLGMLLICTAAAALDIGAALLLVAR